MCTGDDGGIMSNGIKNLDELWTEMLAHDEQLAQQVSIRDA
jgi:hypothetical protein